MVFKKKDKKKEEEIEEEIEEEDEEEEVEEKSKKKEKVKEEEKQKEEDLVVAELPQQPTRQVISEDGKTLYNLITRDEALTEILEKTRETHKSLTE